MTLGKKNKRKIVWNIKRAKYVNIYLRNYITKLQVGKKIMGIKLICYMTKLIK